MWTKMDKNVWTKNGQKMDKNGLNGQKLTYWTKMDLMDKIGLNG